MENINDKDDEFVSIYAQFIQQHKSQYFSLLIERRPAVRLKSQTYDDILHSNVIFNTVNSNCLFPFKVTFLGVIYFLNYSILLLEDLQLISSIVTPMRGGG